MRSSAVRSCSGQMPEPVPFTRMQPRSVPVIALRRDPQVGLLATVPEDFGGELIDALDGSGVAFETDEEAGARHGGPGSVTLIFGNQHPLGVQQVLQSWEYESVLDGDALLPEHQYAPPLDQLLSLGQPVGQDLEIDCEGLGLCSEHVPELIRMARDEALHSGPTESQIIWAPVHAWRALAAMRAEAAIEPLLGLLPKVDDDLEEWIASELPHVFAAIGPASLEPVANCLADDRRGVWSRVIAAESLEHLGKAHPATRADCVASLTGQLRQFNQQEDTLNASLIWDLAQLKAVEAAPLIKEAFAAGKVDEAHGGDWEDIQIELGLKTRREHPRKPNRLTELGAELRTMAALQDELAEIERSGPFSPGTTYVAPPKPGRNDPCPCGSGRKYKKCCGR
jgi:hypothetical protein